MTIEIQLLIIDLLILLMIDYLIWVYLYFIISLKKWKWYFKNHKEKSIIQIVYIYFNCEINIDYNNYKIIIFYTYVSNKVYYK